MTSLTLSSIDMQTLSAQAARVRVLPIADEPWGLWERFNAARANEATLRARVIYPLMELAERADVVAWAQVTVSAHHPTPALRATLVGENATTP